MDRDAISVLQKKNISNRNVISVLMVSVKTKFSLENLVFLFMAFKKNSSLVGFLNFESLYFIDFLHFNFDLMATRKYLFVIVFFFSFRRINNFFWLVNFGAELLENKNFHALAITIRGK